MQLGDEVQWEDEREVDVHFRPQHGSSESRHGWLKNYVRGLDMKRKTAHDNNLVKPIVRRHDEAPDLPRIPDCFRMGRFGFNDISARVDGEVEQESHEETESLDSILESVSVAGR